MISLLLKISHSKIILGTLLMLCGCLKISDYDPSDITRAEYWETAFLRCLVINCSSPNSERGYVSVNIAPGFYFEPVNIEFSTRLPNARIFLSVDGSEPTLNSIEYKEPIHIWKISGTLLKVKAISESIVADDSWEGIYTYPLLKSGQSQCWDVSTNSITSCLSMGQDGEFQSGVARNYEGPLTISEFPDDHITIDKSTGVIWKTCVQDRSGLNCTGTLTDYSYDDAFNSCNNLNSGNGYAGRKDWRLPTLDEALSIFDYGITAVPRINVTAFPGALTNGEIWTTTRVAGNTISFPGVNVDSSVTMQRDQNTYSTGMRTRCVAGFPESRSWNYEEISPGIVYDKKTGLKWQKCSEGQNPLDCSGPASATGSFATGILYCQSLNLGGLSWRSPNIIELHSLLDYRKSTSPFIDLSGFPNSPSGLFVSGTSSPAITATNLVRISFNNSLISISAKNSSTNHNLRCVSVD